jgi:hypothetical protein
MVNSVTAMQCQYTTTQKDTADKIQTANRNAFFQPKLSINQPNDIYEQEADAVADKVVRVQNFSSKKKFFPSKVIQKKCAHCEEEGDNMQRKEINNEAVNTSSQTERYLSSLSGGKKLSKDERTFFESKMEYDFSDVRIHDNSTANESAKTINALAYTYGNNIVFDAGQYQPHSTDGKKLLAHELTHVIQQGSGATLQRKPKYSEQCEPFHQCQIEEGIAVGKQYVDAAIKLLTPVADGTVTTGNEIDKLKFHFKTVVPADVKIIVDNFTSIKKELDAEIAYVCYKDTPDDCKAEGGAVGAFTFCSVNSDVHTCSLYYVCGCEERGRMIVHELAHHFGLCPDYAYNDEAGYATLTKEKAMKNADCYATLASDLFSGNRNCTGMDCLKSKMKSK